MVIKANLPNIGAEDTSSSEEFVNHSILIVGSFFATAKSSRQVCSDLADKLSWHNWNVVTTSRFSRKLARIIDMLTTCWLYRKQYSVAQVDVFSGPSFIWAEAVCWLLRRIGKPYILTLHGGNLPDFSKRNPGRVKRLLLSANAVTTPSHYLLDCMQAYCQNLQLIPNPVDLSAFSFQLRRNVSPRLVWLRAFHQIYNPALALDMLGSLVKEFPKVNLLMIGPDKDGSLRQVQEKARQSNVHTFVSFTGGISKADVPIKLNQCDIFINTTNIDNAPISVLEAMACGLCIVSTNVGGIPYLLKHEQDSLLVPPNDPTAMANAVKRILTEPDLAEYLSQNARRKAEEHDWSVILPQWESLLTSVMNGAQR